MGDGSSLTLSFLCQFRQPFGAKNKLMAYYYQQEIVYKFTSVSTSLEVAPNFNSEWFSPGMHNSNLKAGHKPFKGDQTTMF